MLVRVLETERSQICNHWEELFLNDLPSCGRETSITKVNYESNGFLVTF